MDGLLHIVFGSSIITELKSCSQKGCSISALKWLRVGKCWQGRFYFCFRVLAMLLPESSTFEHPNCSLSETTNWHQGWFTRQKVRSAGISNSKDDKKVLQQPVNTIPGTETPTPELTLESPEPPRNLNQNPKSPESSGTIPEPTAEPTPEPAHQNLWNHPTTPEPPRGTSGTRLERTLESPEPPRQPLEPETLPGPPQPPGTSQNLVKPARNPHRKPHWLSVYPAWNA